jgi:hypothetical protein
VDGFDEDEGAGRGLAAKASPHEQALIEALSALEPVERLGERQQSPLNVAPPLPKEHVGQSRFLQ